MIKGKALCQILILKLVYNQLLKTPKRWKEGRIITKFLPFSECIVCMRCIVVSRISPPLSRKSSYCDIFTHFHEKLLMMMYGLGWVGLGFISLLQGLLLVRESVGEYMLAPYHVSNDEHHVDKFSHELHLKVLLHNGWLKYYFDLSIV